jgi:cytochrome c-type biogenesis protein CcmH
MRRVPPPPAFRFPGSYIAMFLWFIFALMTAAAILAVMRPLGRRKPVAGGGSDVVVYKDQLEEIDRDRAAGLIGDAEAEAARLEISRRLLAAAGAADDQAAKRANKAETAAVPGSNRLRRLAAAAVLLILPFGVPGLYAALGSPDLPGEPAFARAKTPRGQESIASLVGQVEEHLARYPNDGAGWEVVAPVYMRLGRFEDAVTARRKAIELNGETADREADLGEAQAAAANGVVTAAAKAAFERSIARDPHEAKARYFLGLAAEQDGKAEEAVSIWRSLLAEAPAGAPWASFVRQELARASGTQATPGPGTEDVAMAAGMSDQQRLDMARGMVARLADRLQSDGRDVESWLRLVRAYVVLGDRDKARGAVTDAKRALGDRPDAVKRVDDLVKSLGLEVAMMPDKR